MGEAPQFEDGARFGDLRIERRVGSGAFGTVYRALDTILDRPVALKVCAMPDAPVSTGSADAAFAEARFTAKFRHANIVTLYRVHDVGTRAVAFEMEYIEGGTLADRIKDHSAPDRSVALHIARGVTSAVRAAHEAQVVHGDIKPSNILLATDGSPKLTDFGLARIQRKHEKESADFAPGTPLYMAPEVLMGGPSTPASDVWSLGLTLFELFAGEYPFQPTGLQHLFAAIQNTDPRYDRHEFPPVVEAVLRQCLAKDPAQRPSSRQIDEFLHGSVRTGVAPRLDREGVDAIYGREKDLDFLWEAFHSREAPIILQGEPGIGKTALVRAFRDRLLRHNAPVAVARDWASRGIIVAILRAVQNELQKSIAWSGTPSSRRVLEEYFKGDVAALESRGQLVDAVRNALELLVEPTGSCLIVESIHLASEEDVRFLRNLIRQCSDLPILFVLTSRLRGRSALLDDTPPPPHVSGLQHDIEACVHSLGPLSDADIVRVVAAGRCSLVPAVRRRVVASAEGNPLLALEVFRFLIAAGEIEIRDRLARPGDSWEEQRIPDRIQNVVLGRVERLSEDEQALIDVAAVSGRRFSPAFVAEVLGEALLPALRRMQTLYRRTALIVPEGDEFAFSHALVHQSVSRTIAPALRRELSRKMAHILESRERVDDEVVGRHWSAAGDRDRARPFLIRAGNAAERLQENQRAVTLFELAGLGPEPAPDLDLREHVQSLLALAGCYSDLGRGEISEQIYRRLSKRAVELDDDAMRLRVTARQARFFVSFRGLDSVDEKELREAVATLPPGKSRACGWYGLGLLSKGEGNYTEALRRFWRCYRDYREINRLSGCSDAVDQMGTLAKRMGRLRHAARLYRLAASMSERVGRRTNACVSRFNEALAQFELGAIEGVTDLLRDCIRTLESEGAATLAAHAQALLAEVLWAAGDGDDAMSSLAEAERLLRDQSYVPGERTLAFLRAEYAATRGDATAARQHIVSARGILATQGEGHYHRKLDALEVLASAVGGFDDEAMVRARALLDSAADPTTDESLLTILALAQLAGASVQDLAGFTAVRRRASSTDRAIWDATCALTSGEGSAAADELLQDTTVSKGRTLIRAIALTLRNEGSDRDEARSLTRRLGTRLLEPWLTGN